MRNRCGCVLFLILLNAGTPARASDWYPIETGWSWEYSGSGGPHTAAIEDPVMFGGVLVQPLRWSRGSTEYLSEDAAGRILFHGVTNPDGSTVRFSPAVVRMDSELTVGHEWESITTAIYRDAASVEFRRERRSSSFRVLAIQPLQVTTGLHNAAEILHTEEVEVLSRADLAPGAVPPDSLPRQGGLERAFTVVFRDTYGEGVGWIRRTDEQAVSLLFELQSFQRGGVPIGTSSWGELKARFRP